MKSTTSTFLTATAAITDIRSRPTSIPKSTCARCPLTGRTGRTVIGSRPSRWPSSANTILTVWDKKDMYLLHHEEIESLAASFPEAKRTAFCDVWPKLPDAYEVSGKRRNAFHHARRIRRPPDCADSVSQGSCCRTRLRSDRGQKAKRISLYLYRRQGWQRKEHLYLQHLRPRSLLPRSRLASHFLHHRASRR